MRQLRWIVAAGAATLGLACSNLRASDPTNDEQLWLEIINRMRINPLGELKILVNINPGSPATWGTPKSSDPNVAGALDFFNVDANTLYTQWQTLTPVAPLAWNSSLDNAASAHNDLMIANDTQSHQLPGEPSLGTRLTNAGYIWTYAGENIYAYAQSVFEGHAAFAIDWGFGPGGIQSPPGHRQNLMNTNFREIGIAITPENNPATQVGPLVVTQDFGKRSGNAFVTGVVYNDAVARDGFYTPGEGLGGVSISASANGTTSYASGGYSLQLAPGTYDIRLSGGALTSDIVYWGVSVGANNLKIDSQASWIADANGNWRDPANWLSLPPHGPGTTAYLGNVVSSPRVISLGPDAASGSATVGTINFDSAQSYTIAGPGTLSLQAGNPGISAAINIYTPASHTISADVQFVSPTAVSIPAAASLTLSGGLVASNQTVTRTGAGTLNWSISGRSGAGTVSLDAQGGTTNINKNAPNFISIENAGTQVNITDSTSTALSINAGTATVVKDGNKVLSLNNLSISNGGKLDLVDNDMIFESSGVGPISDLTIITGYIKSARGSGANLWQGSGITSSAAAADAKRLTGLAVIQNQKKDQFGNLVPIYKTFDGMPVDMGSVLVKYTWNGDMNLDGIVNFDDYFLINTGFLSNGALGGYRNGDLNFDGIINFDDYFLINSAFLGQGSTPLSSAVRPAIVPEPTIGALGLLAASVLVRRRRRA